MNVASWGHNLGVLKTQELCTFLPKCPPALQMQRTWCLFMSEDSEKSSRLERLSIRSICFVLQWLLLALYYLTLSSFVLCALDRGHLEDKEPSREHHGAFPCFVLCTLDPGHLRIRNLVENTMEKGWGWCGTAHAPWHLQEPGCRHMSVSVLSLHFFPWLSVLRASTYV